jgi:transcriptional regulator with XRE-family HTH domain
MTGIELQDRRKSLGLTQKGLATLSNISRHSTIAYENGQTKIPSVKCKKLRDFMDSYAEKIGRKVRMTKTETKIAEMVRKDLEVEFIALHNKLDRLIKLHLLK